MKRSRSTSCAILSIGCPVQSARMPLSRSRMSSTSRAAISMSAAVPCAPVDGWWIMMRELGRALRLPGAPAATRIAAIEAAMPTQ